MIFVIWSILLKAKNTTFLALASLANPKLSHLCLTCVSAPQVLMYYKNLYKEKLTSLVSIRQAMTPSDHQSTAWPYGSRLTTSGAVDKTTIA